MRRPFLISAIIGIGVIIISLVLMLTGPQETGPMADGFFTPIIAFEFASDVHDVNLIFYSDDSQLIETAISSITFGTRLDFLFMVLYGAFLLAFSLTCASLTGNRLFYLPAFLAILTALFDLLENLQLLSIMQQLGSGNFTTQIDYLHLFTWLKWGTLSAIFLLLIPFFQKAGVFSHFFSHVRCLTASFGRLSIFHSRPPKRIIRPICQRHDFDDDPLHIFISGKQLNETSLCELHQLN